MISCAAFYDKVIFVHTFLEVKEFKCDVNGCSIKFKSSAKLCRHKRVVHTRAASVQCDLCERTFSRLDHLNMHRDRVHSMLPADKMLRCLVASCQKRFATFIEKYPILVFRKDFYLKYFVQLILLSYLI